MKEHTEAFERALRMTEGGNSVSISPERLRAAIELMRAAEPKDPAAELEHCNDSQYGCVVRAVSEKSARLFAAEKNGAEGRGVWLSPKKSICVELVPDGEAGIVLRDFLPG